MHQITRWLPTNKQKKGKMMKGIAIVNDGLIFGAGRSEAAALRDADSCWTADGTIKDSPNTYIFQCSNHVVRRIRAHLADYGDWHVAAENLEELHLGSINTCRKCFPSGGKTR